MSTTRNTLIFYAGLFYGEFPFPHSPVPFSGDLPDGAYVRFPELVQGTQWYRSDFTPVLPQDVPPEIQMLCLILNP